MLLFQFCRVYCCCRIPAIHCYFRVTVIPNQKTTFTEWAAFLCAAPITLHLGRALRVGSRAFGFHYILQY